MIETSSRKVTAYTRSAQIVVGVMGIYHSLAGVALLFFPVWFFQYIGPFPLSISTMRAIWEPMCWQ
jgi:hypothetical protein